MRSGADSLVSRLWEPPPPPPHTLLTAGRLPCSSSTPSCSSSTSGELWSCKLVVVPHVQHQHHHHHHQQQLQSVFWTTRLLRGGSVNTSSSSSQRSCSSRLGFPSDSLLHRRSNCSQQQTTKTPTPSRSPRREQQHTSIALNGLVHHAAADSPLFHTLDDPDAGKAMHNGSAVATATTAASTVVANGRQTVVAERLQQQEQEQEEEEEEEEEEEQHKSEKQKVSSQVLQRKRRGKSRKLQQQEEEAANSVTEHLKAKLDSSSSPPENVVMPPQKQVGLEADVKHIDLKDLVVADSVYNKELSWLAFNWRVLHMALDVQTPLFERLRFLAISARNLDEFFCKRVGALKRQEAAGVENLITQQRRMAWTPQHQLKNVAREVRLMVETQIKCLMQDLLPALKKEGLNLLDYNKLHHHQKEQLRQYFKSSLEPILTPLAVDPGHPFPFIGNLTLSIAVVLRDPYDDTLQFAIVSIPSGVQRWKSLALDNDHEYMQNTFVSVDQIITNNLDLLFGGMEIKSAHMFRTTRNADVARNEEEAEDLLEMITDEMRELRFAPFVRLEVDCEMPQDVIQRLSNELGLSNKDDVYTVCGQMALGALTSHSYTTVIHQVGIADLDSLPVKLGVDSPLIFTPWSPKTHPRLQGSVDIFDVIRKGDILVQHPYHSFVTSTQHFVEAASNDPRVVAIKATLYRTNNDSPVISALVKAAESGKQVAVLVEVKARFDEVRNMGFAQMLEDAGCNVAYGLVGLKTHCKCIMVVRQEENGLRTYVHLGTGNYNPRTASVYSDFGLLSCNPDLGMDVTDLFKYLTGYHRQVAYRKLLVAPGTMRCEFVRLIEREIANARAGHPASIVVKCNGLDDHVMVEKLYEASMAGVIVDCIVRGICRIRPGVPNVSENIRVVSIVGRFLEHHRIFRFENRGKVEYYMGSADWMTRNLTRRVEVVTPIEDESSKQEIQETMDACLCDQRRGWEMRPDGRYQLLGVGSMKKPPRKHIPEAASARLITTVEEMGLHVGLMETVAKRCRKAKKVNLRKKDGSVQKWKNKDGN